jgi:hypothetical protein
VHLVAGHADYFAVGQPVECITRQAQGAPLRPQGEFPVVLRITIGDADDGLGVVSFKHKVGCDIRSIGPARTGAQRAAPDPKPSKAEEGEGVEYVAGGVEDDSIAEAACPAVSLRARVPGSDRRGPAAFRRHEAP